MAEAYGTLTLNLRQGGRVPFDYAVVDEAQDISVPQLRLPAALGAARPNALFFAGDPGQRIFRPAFSWIAQGVDVRGRSRSLRVNYRTSHQIRQQADRLLDKEVADGDGQRESRSDTVSVFNGPPPVIARLGSEAEETECVARYLTDCIAAGVLPQECAVFVRSEAQLARAQAAVSAAGLNAAIIDERVETVPGSVALGTMHLAKRLEFRAVAVMACDDEIVPLQERIDTVADESDLHEVYDTERQLLYVACTRARDRLLLSGVEHVSEFVEDLGGP
jgi:superfamily I DNA/RNA helicase